MSDALLGIIIGGAIGVVPSLVIVFVEVWKQRQNRIHEIYIKQIDLLVAPRLDALRDYSEQVGGLTGVSYDLRKYSPDQLRAAHLRLNLYVSEETRAVMADALPILLKDWEDNKSDKKSIAKMDNSIIKRLMVCLNTEISLSFNDADYPARRRKQHHGKKNTDNADQIKP